MLGGDAGEARIWTPAHMHLPAEHISFIFCMENAKGHNP